jgi:hypothetical protein
MIPVIRQMMSLPTELDSFYIIISTNATSDGLGKICVQSLFYLWH